MPLGLSPLVDVLGLPVRNWDEGFVRARQRRRWRTHGCPALRVGSAVEPREYGGAVPSPRGARRGSVRRGQRLGLWLVLHGLHLILLCAAPDEMQKHEKRPSEVLRPEFCVSVPQKNITAVKTTINDGEPGKALNKRKQHRCFTPSTGARRRKRRVRF